MSSVVVVDASAVVALVTSRGARRQRYVGDWRSRCRHALHLIDAEVGNALRGLVLRQVLDPTDAGQRRRQAARAVNRRHGHGGALGERAWQLRDNLSFYDALYVALAERLRCPLVTGDARLARPRGSAARSRSSDRAPRPLGRQLSSLGITSAAKRSIDSTTLAWGREP